MRRLSTRCFQREILRERAMRKMWVKREEWRARAWIRPGSSTSRDVQRIAGAHRSHSFTVKKRTVRGFKGQKYEAIRYELEKKSEREERKFFKIEIEQRWRGRKSWRDSDGWFGSSFHYDRDLPLRGVYCNFVRKASQGDDGKMKKETA